MKQRILRIRRRLRARHGIGAGLRSRPGRYALASLLLVWAAFTAAELDPGVAAYLSGNYGEAARAFRAQAERGVPRAQTMLGLMYEHGEGVTQDPTEAARWYRRAAQQGERNAQFNLGALYAQGKGVRKDLVEARDWYLLAAAQGHPRARAMLAQTSQHSLRLPDIIARSVVKRSSLRLAPTLVLYDRGAAPATSATSGRASGPVRLRLDLDLGRRR